MIVANQIDLWRQQLRDLVTGPTCRVADATAQARLNNAFGRTEYAGLQLAIAARLGATVILTGLVTWQLGIMHAASYYPWIFGFMVASYAQLYARRPGFDAAWKRGGFALLDFVILVGCLILPSPFGEPGPMKLGFDAPLYLVVFLALATLTYSTTVVIWSGIGAIATWMAATFWIANQPGVTTHLRMFSNINAVPAPERWAEMLDPWHLDYSHLVRQVVLLAVIATILAIGVTRSRRFVARQAETERARANLARHFSPNMVNELAAMDEPLAAVRTVNAAVLFADIVGFTRMTEGMPPEQVVALLRTVHERLAGCIFEHRGTLDKYLGDGIMATFGTPRTSGQDAGNALRAARAMLKAIADLNLQRRLLRQPPINLVIGIHYGPVTLGNIGDDNRLEYAVLGEVVNIAARLEAMTRALDALLCISDDVVVAHRAEIGDSEPLTGDLLPLSPQPIRGLSQRIAVWTLPRSADAAQRESEPGHGFGLEKDGPRPTLH